jgi:DNA-binding IclR family transcriptional regulator
MPSYLFTFIADQNWFRVLNVLQTLARPGTLREISDLSGISLGGTGDILRRLIAAKLIEKSMSRRRASYRVKLDPVELSLIKQIAAQGSADAMSRRAALLSTKTDSAIGWIEQTNAVIKHGKRKTKNADRTS